LGLLAQGNYKRHNPACSSSYLRNDARYNHNSTKTRQFNTLL